jgi:uncharacterized protein DUF4389
MSIYPVHYEVVQPTRFTRLQLLLRFVAFCALGLLGVSFGTIFLVAYLALPVFAAGRLTVRAPADYVAEDGPRVRLVLHWLAAISAWVGLISDQLPVRAPAETVHLQIDPTAQPSSVSATWRILTGLPSAIVLALLCWIGMFVWLWAALTVLFRERVGAGAFGYLVGLQRWSIRLLAYQASLVDEYPPFSFADTPPALPSAPLTS